MAKLSPIYALLFVFLLLVASTEIGVVEGQDRLCEKRCQKCHGDCKKTEECNKFCIKYEGAVSGACVGSVCYCYFKC